MENNDLFGAKPFGAKPFDSTLLDTNPTRQGLGSPIRGLVPTLRALSVALLVSGWASSSLAVGTRHFVLESGADFGKGELQGAAVDSTGKLRPGLDLGAIEVLDADSVWSMLPQGDGLYLGTGNEAKLIEVRGGKSTVVASAEAMAITTIAQAFGKILVGTMPGKEILELKEGKLVPFAQLEGAEHVWALSYDEQARALYAATGPDGKLFRVMADGTAQVYFDAEQKHLVSVLAQGKRLYVGSSGEARLYEVSGPGRASVLYDFEKTEVRSMVLGSDGSLYTIVNELKGGPRSDSIKKDQAGGPHAGSPSGGKGQLVRFHPDGHPEVLYENDSSHLVSLTLNGQGKPVVGTGLEGRVVVVDENHRSAVIADVEERQAAELLFAGQRGWVVASDPIVVHPIEGVGGEEAIFLSEVLDAGIRARFGRVDFEGRGKFEVTTRTGSTKEADETWTDWSTPLEKGASVPSAPGRFLQVRVRLLDPQAEVGRIDVPFVTDNLRPVVTDISIKSGVAPSGSSGVHESGAPLEGKSSAKIKLSWDVDNPDEDPLMYRVEYRPESGEQWFDALDPGEVLTSDSFDWNTENLPEGRYRVRVTASDELANPPSRVQQHRLESESILVDNTAPRLTGVRIAQGKLVGVASDGVGPIRRLELRLPDQQRWIPFEPTDGIFDEAKESFSFDLSTLTLPDAALLTVRVFDTAGNFDVGHVRLTAAR